MRFTVATATAVAAGALLIGVPAAAANASTPGPNTSPCGSSTGFQRVAVGQTVDQVNQEMGAVGRTVAVTTGGGHERLQNEWRDCNISGLFSFEVVFNSSPGQPLLVGSKSFVPTLPQL